MQCPNVQTIAEIATFQAAHRPHETAFLCEGRTLTYEALQLASNRAARGIRAAGLRRGARVAYVGKDSEYYYELFFACAKSETVIVPINWRLTASEVDQLLRDSRAEMLFVEHDFLATVASAEKQLSTLRAVVDMDEPGKPGAGFQAWMAAHSADHVRPETTSEDPIIQIYTSGTTGLPKGAVLPQRYFFRIREGLAEAKLDWIDWLPTDVSLIGIPGFHVAGIWWAVQGLLAGVPNVIMPTFRSRDAVQLTREHGVTTTFVVPAMLQMMLAEPGDVKSDLSTLRKVVYGGSPITEALMARCLNVIGCDFAQVYGLTEAGGVATLLPPKDHVVGGPLTRSAGLPFPNVDIAIVDSDGKPVPPGTVGELHVRTPAAMLEYWDRKDATAETLVDGWLHTGDAGYVDADGYLFISDRIKDLIIVAGENVYPAEIENALGKLPAVSESAVIGVPDERWGEAIHAFIVLRAGMKASARDVMVSLKGLIADFKIPTRYDFVDSIPRNPSGKILRRNLRDKFWVDRQRKVN